MILCYKCIACTQSYNKFCWKCWLQEATVCDFTLYFPTCIFGIIELWTFIKAFKFQFLEECKLNLKLRYANFYISKSANFYILKVDQHNGKAHNIMRLFTMFRLVCPIILEVFLNETKSKINFCAFSHFYRVGYYTFSKIFV